MADPERREYRDGDEGGEIRKTDEREEGMTRTDRRGKRGMVER